MAKYIEDVKQEEKDVPDLLEAIMRPTCLVKEELRHILLKMNRNNENPIIQDFNFLDSRNLTFSRRRPMLAFSPSKF